MHLALLICVHCMNTEPSGWFSPVTAVACGKIPMSSDHNITEQDTQTENEIELRLLARLQERPHVSQRGLASDLGVSLGSINYCLKALSEKGFVKAENFSKSNNKLGYAYLLTPSGIAAKSRLTASFLKRKRAEYRRLAQEIADLEAQMRQDKAERK